MRAEQPEFQPRDAGYVARVRNSFGLQRAMALIGAELAVVEPGFAEIHLPLKPEITQQHGFIHGGVVGMIADSAAGYAANTLTAADTSVLTVEYKLNLIAPADGERLVARGEVIKPGRTLIITKAEVFAIRDERWTLCALMQQTIMAMQGKAERAAAEAPAARA
ncbi:MAG: PaaI family thioesterase [Thauera sp.]